jgi:ribosomal protein S18 acetylase RimI-like enzyme
MSFRAKLREGDIAAIRALVAQTKVFSPAEVEIAVEVASAGLHSGEASGYHFFVAEDRGGLAGFTAFGPIPATAASWDLYWIAVRPAGQRNGIGGRLLAASEDRAAALGCRRLYVDTSGRADYAPARAFYERHGYRRAATLEDFYAAGDAKLIYLRVLGAPATRP